MAKKALDLFLGTKSVSAVLEKIGYEVDTLDNNPSFQPTFCTSILDWDYKTIPIHYYDIIHL